MANNVLLTMHAGVKFVTEECWVCGLPFALSETFYDAKKRFGGGFKCPAGCALTYGEGAETSRIKALEAEAARLRAEKDQEQAAKERARAELARAARKIRRTEKGVCPHCNRGFANLRRHMECKHKVGVPNG